MPTIHIPQKNLEINALTGENLMDALIKAHLPVASSCLGEGICSKCVVDIAPQGELNDLEKLTLARNKIQLTKRLSCQVFITEHLTVKTSYW